MVDPQRFDQRGTLQCGRDVQIDVNCVFEGAVSLADGVSIGANCVIANAAIDDGAVIHPFTHIDGEKLGVSVGRGAFYDPWIFRRTDHYLRTGELLPEPDFAERVRVLCRHFERDCEFYGEEQGSKLFRKVAPWYAKRFGPSKPFKARIISIKSRADFESALAEFLEWRRPFCDEAGNLLPKFTPDPMIASFMRAADDPVFARESIPVPKGPVEVW